MFYAENTKRTRLFNASRQKIKGFLDKNDGSNNLEPSLFMCTKEKKSKQEKHKGGHGLMGGFP